jgi:solute carrier family 25 (mitochondrial folate transporter), member 32
VVRTRLHTSPVVTARPLRHTVRIIWAEAGGGGFYRGLGTNLMRVVPAAATTFLTYELTLRSLRRWLSGDGNSTAGARR